MIQEKKINLYHPRYLGYWLILGILWLLVKLPQSWRMAIGSGLGRVLFKLMSYRSRISKINIDKVYPEKSEDERKALLKAFSQSLGKGIIETGMAWFGLQNDLQARCILEADEDALVLLRDPKQPVILIGLHSTLLELGMRLLGFYVNSAGMYKPMRNDFFNEWIKQHRAKAATELVHFKDMRHTLSLLKAGGNLWYALDQDMGPRVSVFAPFFGIQAASVDVLPKLRQLTGARWVPVFIWREAGDRRYVIKIYPEIKSKEEDSAVDIMTQVNAIFEREIRQYPEQYYWVHRRFKHQPNKQKHDYPTRDTWRYR